MGFMQLLILIIEHPNPDISTLAVKIMTEIGEDRALDQQDLFAKIID